jgi:hypothetical protein
MGSGATDRVCVLGQRGQGYIDNFGMFIRLAYKPKSDGCGSLTSLKSDGCGSLTSLKSDGCGSLTSLKSDGW